MRKLKKVAGWLLKIVLRRTIKVVIKELDDACIDKDIKKERKWIPPGSNSHGRRVTRRAAARKGREH